MWGWNSLLRSGIGSCRAGSRPGSGPGMAAASFLGPQVLYLAFFVSALAVARMGGGSAGFWVLILGSCAGLFGSLPGSVPR